MLSAIHPFLLAQFPLVEAGQFLLVVAISFLLITIIVSTYRFHHMVQIDETDLDTVGDCNHFFFVQVTRYLSKIERISSGFAVIIVQFTTESSDDRTVQKKLLKQLSGAVRSHPVDKVCRFNEDCIGLIISVEKATIELFIKHIVTHLKQIIINVPEINSWRAGMSHFPQHGITTKTIIDTACQAMETVDLLSDTPLCLAPLPEKELRGEEEPPFNENEESGLEKRNFALDPLTGVIKPSAIGSYMRNYFMEIRRQKKEAAIFFVGINRIDRIIELYGQLAANKVIAGVSEIIQQVTRETDLIGRYDRENFLMLIPCIRSQSELIAARLRVAVQKKTLLFENKRIKVTISIGISIYPDHGRKFKNILFCAFHALKTVQDWNTSACLVYDPTYHIKKGKE